MKIIVTPSKKKYPTFKDVPVADLFIFDGNVHVKVTSADALKLGAGSGSYARIGLDDQINFVTSLTVEAAQ